jgi:phosphoglycolate phosphatase
MNLIFDFDGTLVDSFDKAIEKFNILADEFHFDKIHLPESHKLKDLSSIELTKYLKIPLYKIPRALYKARKYMKNEIPKLAPITNLPQTLQKIHSANFSLGILTSNSEENVATWLDINKIGHFFNFIHIESNYFGKGRIIKKLLKKHQINKSNAFYIGDETRDITAAKQNDIYSVAVTWGFNSEKTLLQYQPDYVARTPEDLLDIFGIARA